MKGAQALVLGATGLIGRAIGLSLAQAGADVLLHGRSPERVALLRHETGRDAIACDLTSEDGRRVLLARVEPWRRLDVLVLSFGAYARSADPADFERQLGANLLAPYAVLRSLLPLILTARGQVVFMNSSQGLKASRDVGQYAATQHGMRAIADSLREEVNPLGVRVLSVFCGSTATERQRAICALDNSPYRPELLIQPADVAHAVMAMLTVPRTAEVTEMILRPMHAPPSRNIGL